jgi:hypothetical protein
MSLKIPTYIQKSGIVSVPISYKWNSNIGLHYYAAKDMNIRLYESIDASNFKAKMSIAVAVTEWIVWRFYGQVNLEDALFRVEAAWASSIDSNYINDLSLKMTKDDNIDSIGGALELALCLLGEIDSRYANGNIFLAGRIVNQTMLARHLMPNKKVFNDWLSLIFQRTAKLFPRGAKYDRRIGTYDASHEKPVPRDFFDPAFKYTETAAQEAVRAFLQSLDPKQNPYLFPGKK